MNLLACSGCKRQLDVTALEPGDEVRCVCGDLLAVGPPRDVRVRGLTCGHCGGAVRRDQTSCTYCSAGLEEEDLVESLVCPACFARLAEDSHFCRGCGAEMRPQALRALPEDHGCPRCDGTLQVRLLERDDVVECGGCGGLWLDAEHFRRLRVEARRGAAGPAYAESAPRATPEAEVRYVPCPECRRLMLRRQFRVGHRSAGVVLDLCKDHGVWFDADELAAVLAFVCDEGVDDERWAGALPGPVPTSHVAPGPAVGRAEVRVRGRGESALRRAGSATAEAVLDLLSSLGDLARRGL